MRTVASNYFKVIVEGCVFCGAKADELYALIEGGKLALSNPSTRFSVDNVIDVINAAAAQTQDESLGLKVGLRIRMDTFVDVGFTLTFADNLAEVMTINSKYQKLTQQIGTTDLRVDARYARVHWTPYDAPDAERYRHFVEIVFAAYATIGRWLIFGGPNPVQLMQFRHKAPQNLDAHHVVFGPKVKFGADKDMMAFPAELTEIALPTRNPALKELMLPKLDMQLEELGQPQTFRRQTMHILQSRLMSGRPKISEVAAMMDMSERNFRRYLKKEGIRFRDILEDARRETCEIFLRQGNLNHADIGARLGYSDQSSYTRAFRAWFGVTPSRYRRDVKYSRVSE